MVRGRSGSGVGVGIGQSIVFRTRVHAVGAVVLKPILEFGDLVCHFDCYLVRHVLIVLALAVVTVRAVLGESFFYFGHGLLKGFKGNSGDLFEDAIL